VKKLTYTAPWLFGFRYFAYNPTPYVYGTPSLLQRQPGLMRQTG